MTIVTNKDELEEINNAILQKKYNNVDADAIVSGDEKSLVTNAINKKDEEKGFLKSYIVDPIASFFTGNDREEFKNMGEINGAKLKSIGNEIALNTGFALTSTPNAQIDMVKKFYPGAIISKDKFDNVVITLPENAVKDGSNRTYYLNKPGITTKDVVEGITQMLQYIPGAGFVTKNVGGGILKKGLSMGGVNAVTGMAQDVATIPLGNQQGKDGIIPFVEDDKLLLNAGFGFAGEPIGRFLARYSGFNFIKDGINRVIPSKINFTTKSGTFLNNKLEVTDETKKLALKHFDDVSLASNEKVLKQYAQALEDGILPQDAVHIVGANKFGISLWKAQASGNKKVLKYIDEARNGVHGPGIQNIVRYQDQIQLNQTFDYLTKFRNNLIKNKKTQQTTTLPGQKTPVEDTIDNITNQITSIKNKMDENVDKMYNAIDWNGKIKAPVVKNLTSNIKLMISGADGLGQPINKITMPNATAALNNINKFAKTIENSNISKISLIALENQRRSLNSIINTTRDATDKKALMLIKNEFDTFFDKTINGALSTGDKKVLEQIKKARLESSNVKKIFTPSNIGKIKDTGGAYLQGILNGKYSALQINNYLYGNASLSANSVKQSTDLLKRLTSTIFKPNSEGFDLLVDGAAQRMINNSFRKIGTNDVFDPKLFIKEVEQMVNGNGKEISKILFSKDQLSDLLGFAKQLEKTTTLSDFKNVDKGGKKFLEVFNSAFRSLAGILGFQAAGIQGTLFTRFTADAITKTAKHNQAIDDITQAIAFTKLPDITGGQGLIQKAYADQNFIKQNQNRDQASTLEQLKIIEDLNKYR
tara:strand:- start:1414 stop:3870 length:2457 start_codon:yes stop_codon:yes gene_type:complete